MKKNITIIIICFLFLFLFFPVTIFAANINGIIGIIQKSGDIKPGARVEVFLTTKVIPIIPVTELKSPSPVDEVTGNLEAIKIIELKNAGIIVKSLDSFSKNFKNEMGNPTFVKAKTISNLKGNFTFTNIPSGKYFVVVQSVIAMNMLVWQIPITIAKKNIDIELSNDNLTFPALNTSIIFKQ